MNKKIIYLGFLSVFVGGVFSSPVFSQNIPNPSMAIDCYGTLEAWKADSSLRNYMATHNCYCPSPNSSPVCTPVSSPTQPPKTGSGLSPSQQMQLQMFKGIMQPFFNSLFDFSSLFAPPDTSYQDALRKQQEKELMKQQEEAKKKALEAWNKHLKDAQEQARREAESRQKAGQDILSHVRIGSGPFGSPIITMIGPRASERETLSMIDWDNPRPQSTSAIKTTETAKEQLLKAAYFSKMADTFLQSGDLEAARFYAGLVFEGDAASPRQINYNPPKELIDAMDSEKATELNNKLTKMSRFYKLAMPEFEKLQGLYTDLEDVKTKKEESKKKIGEIEKQIKELEAKKQVEESTGKKTPSPTEDLLAKALALKQQAENEYQEAIKNEEKLLKEKQDIENKLNELKGQLLVEGKR
jgi:tetratricopeptide (TPR) repeat protein